MVSRFSFSFDSQSATLKTSCQFLKISTRNTFIPCVTCPTLMYQSTSCVLCLKCYSFVWCVSCTRVHAPHCLLIPPCFNRQLSACVFCYLNRFVFLGSARQEHDVEMVRRSSSLNDHWQPNPPCWILRTGLCVARRPWNLPPEYLNSRWWCCCTHQHHQHIVSLEERLFLIKIIYVNVFRFCITSVRTVYFVCVIPKRNSALCYKDLRR